MKAPVFNGKGSLETFLAQFEICSTFNKWIEAEKSAHLKCSLLDGAGQLIWDSKHPNELGYEELTDKLRRRYGSTDQQE